jgi:hypothetical protein
MIGPVSHSIELVALTPHKSTWHGCPHTTQVNMATKSQSLDYPRLKSQVCGGGLQTPLGVTDRGLLDYPRLKSQVRGGGLQRPLAGTDR